MDRFRKKDMRIWLIFTLIIAGIITSGLQIRFVGSVWGTPEENQVLPLGWNTLLHFLFAFIVANALACLVWYLNRFYQTRAGRDQAAACGTEGCEKWERKKIFIICTAILAVAWLPYYLAYFPGTAFSDTCYNLIQALNMDELGMYALNNYHPVLYTLLWRVAILAGRVFGLDINGASAIFLTLQYLFMAGTLAYMLCWMKRHGFHRKWSYFLLGFLALFPLFPWYAVSLWKDTVYSCVLLLFALCLGEYALSRADGLLKSGSWLRKMALLGLLVSFFRNNGKYIVFLTFAVIALTGWKKLREYRKFLLMAVSVILTVQVIQGPVYDAMDYNVNTTVESLGVPLQQMAYLVYYDYDLSEEETAYIDSVCPIESIKENYNPCLFDTLKAYTPGFDITVIENDVTAFFRFYVGLLIRHPIGCLKGYMLATAGFWAPGIASYDGYISNIVWSNDLGLEGNDLLEEWFGFTIRGHEIVMKPISSAVFLFFLLYAAFICRLRGEEKKLLLLLPAFGNWLTIMIATPIACSLRYVYILVLMLPLDLYLICSSGEGETEQRAHKAGCDTEQRGTKQSATQNSGRTKQPAIQNIGSRQRRNPENVDRADKGLQ